MMMRTIITVMERRRYISVLYPVSSDDDQSNGYEAQSAVMADSE